MKLLTLIMVLFISVSLFGRDYTKTKELTIPAEDVKLLDIDCGAGFLKITGHESLSAIEVTADIEIDVSNEEEFQQIVDKYLNLSLEKHGSTAKLVSNYNQSKSFFGFLSGRNFNGKVNLTINIPAHIALRIDDGSGSINIRDIDAKIDLDDGSGDTEITHINGKINIDDGSGSLEITDIKGSVHVDDGSGNLVITNIFGDCFLDDGSGTVRVSEIEGDVQVDDGSGSIYIDDIKGDVIIKESGSGSVAINNVDGKIYRHDD